MITFASPDISAEEAHRRQAQGALLLDVREPYEFVAGHALGALNIPLGQLATGQSAAIAPERKVLVVCASGSRSALAVQLVRRAGHTPA